MPSLHAVKLSQVDLNLLVALDALLKERNVTLAGQRIGLSQPAMSAALRRLRELFGDPLLERVGREYRLTPVALALEAPLVDSLATIERTLQRNVNFDPSTARRTFRIACSDYVVLVLLRALVEKLERDAPGIRLRIATAESNTSKHLAARRIDLAIAPAGNVPGFDSEELFRDRWLCAVWRGNEAVGHELRCEQFLNTPHVSYAIDAAGPTLADRFTQALGAQLQVHVTTESFAALPFLVRGTHMIAVIQQRLGVRLAAASETRLLPIPVPLNPLSMVMTWNGLLTHDPGHRWLRNALKHLAAASCKPVDPIET